MVQHFVNICESGTKLCNEPYQENFKQRQKTKSKENPTPDKQIKPKN